MKSGDLVMTCDPYVHVIMDTHRKSTCEECLDSKSQSLKTCSGCHYVYYCSRRCQRAAWKDHKHECKRIKFLTAAPYLGQTDYLRLIAKVIIKMRQGNKGETTLPDGTQRTFQDLMSHEEEIFESDKQKNLINVYHVKLKMFFDCFGGDPSLEEVQDIYGKLKINAFGIENTFGYDVAGTGLYVGGSVFDHSCSPNAEVSYIGKRMFVKCIQDGPGDFSSIRLRYCDMLVLHEERREHLCNNYYFDCQCDDCLNPNSNREAYGKACVRCPRCTKGVPVKEEYEEKIITCDHCNNVVPKKHIESYRELRVHVKEFLDAHGGEIPEKIASVLVRRMKPFFFPTERTYLAILKKCIRYFTQQTMLLEALETTSQVLEAYKMIYAPYSNEICRMEVHLAYLYCASGQLRKAKDVFDKAQVGLSKCYPPDHSFMQGPQYTSVKMTLSA